MSIKTVSVPLGIAKVVDVGGYPSAVVVLEIAHGEKASCVVPPETAARAGAALYRDVRVTIEWDEEETGR